jgi:hypothetical protein
MELLDRYLQAVRKHLPWQRQDDIIAELRANLEAQLEEKEAELGRPLTAVEMEDWIKQLGSPLQMAAHYRPQQYLIGPTLFPIYRNVLKIALIWATIIYCLAQAIALVTKTPHLIDLVRALFAAPGFLLTVAAWATLVFAVLEYLVARQIVNIPALCPPAGAWSPAGLAPLDPAGNSGAKPKSFASAIAEIIFGFFWLVWLLLVPAHPYLLLGPGAYYVSALPYKLAPIWVPVYWCIVACGALQLGWNLIELVRAGWQKTHPLLPLVYRAGGLVPVILLLTTKDHALVLLKNPALDQARLGATLSGINETVNMSVNSVCAVLSILLVGGIVKLILNTRRKRLAASH